ncbi:hypothetical protein VN24_01900 [Paenibacillus beijingensis]|uniref:Uncharacterized protein n=1 Tax=Paenibacillus beijingensis TaxID=1126833 RepID=A0A0D5NEN9_9BACL|nr:hypothetical protein VN24_01900 [Paenibacillus beijingensis]
MLAGTKQMMAIHMICWHDFHLEVYKIINTIVAGADDDRKFGNRLGRLRSTGSGIVLFYLTPV